MDTSQPIVYRALNVNGAALQQGSRVLRGFTVENVDYSNVPAVGYTEKRAAADGRHASDVYLDARMLDMSGLIYATSTAELFDFLHTLRSVFSPTSAYLDDPGNRGFLPIYYSQPTLDVASWPSSVLSLYMNVRPMGNPRFAINRDRIGRNGKGPGALPWQVHLMAKDPRVYVTPDQTVDVSGAPHTNVAGNAINRGDYEAPFNVLLAIGATVPPAGTFRVTGLNGIDMTITIEAKANTVYRWHGDDRILMTQDVSGGTSAPEVLRMDLVSFATAQRRPMVPASINPPSRPFTTPFHYWSTVTLAAGSRLFWSEAFA